MTGTTEQKVIRHRLTNLDIYYGWFVVLACYLGAFVIFGIAYSFGVFFEPIATEYGLNRAQTSISFSIQTFVKYTVSAAVMGIFAQRYGSRKLFWTGAFCIIAGLSGVVLADSYYTLLLAFSGVLAVGLGTIFIIAYATIPRWFHRRRGLATGITTMGLATGTLAVPPTATYFLQRWDWQIAYLALLAPMTILLLIAVILYTDRPSKLGVDTSDEFPDGYDGNTGGSIGELKSIVKSRSFVLAITGWVFIFFSLYAFLGHIVPFIDDIGLKPWVGASALSIVGATGIIGRAVLGYASDLIGRVRLFGLSGSLMAIPLILLPAVNSWPTVVSLVAVFGLGFAGADALLSPLTAELFGATNIFSVFGLLSASFGIAGLIAPYVAGRVYDIYGEYTYVFVVIGVVGLVGVGLTMRAGQLEDAI
ncbi:nitrate/nitrite transporter [Halobium palmae]|uniref:Nitrate/nitrite transporter n=1 Tax=Halobium palmae TaxID=1776492 RepID=A0ABD5RUN7_9EURY